MVVKHLFKEIYVGKEGIDYYSFNSRTRAWTNRERIRIKIEDIENFKTEHVKIRDPVKLLEFLAEEFGYELYISGN